MNNNKLLTIIITTYKRPLKLKRCIESIQKNEYLEILVVDDCPEKSAQAITNQYSQTNYISKPNKSNVANSRNLGIRHSKGKYILFLDDDDYLLNNAIGEILKSINYFSNFDFIFFNYLIQDLMSTREIRLFNISLKQLLVINSIPIGSFLVKNPNYHIGDYNLYYVNIRENVIERMKAYKNEVH